MLATRYRPRTYRQLVGQPAAYGLFKVVARARAHEIEMPHSFLLAGPRGTGKTSTARLVAASLNCRQPTANGPCNECEPCAAIISGSYPGIVEVDGASAGGVDSVRSLRDVAWSVPIDEFTVIILDEAQAMTTAAYSALLHQLEEAPPHVVYLLATTDPWQLPPTVRSRCILIQFRTLLDPDISRVVSEVAAAEGYQLPDNGLAKVVSRARGSLRDALNSLEQVILSGPWSDELAEALLPGDLVEFANTFVESAVVGDVATGRRVTGEAYTLHRDSGELCDAILNRLDALAAEDRVPLARLASAIREVWAMRVRTRTPDVALALGCWYVVYHALNGAAQTRVAASAPKMAAAVTASADSLYEELRR